MTDLVRDIILLLASMLVLLFMRRSSEARVKMPGRVWPFILVGFSLLLMGRGLEMADTWGMIIAPAPKLLLQEVLGFCLGFAVLATGLIRWLPRPETPRSKPPRRAAPRRAAAAARKRSGKASRGAPPVLAEAATAAREHYADEMLKSVLKSSLSGVLMLKAYRDEADEIVDYEVVVINETAEQILGRSGATLCGRQLLQAFPCIAAEQLLGDSIGVIETGLPFRSERQFGRGRERCWYEFLAVKFRDGLAVTFSDISDRKRAEEQLRHAAHHDTLTGLPNRALFTERLEQAINRAKRFSDYTFAILFLDFDRFKIVNDSLGHEAGDRLLIGIAERLRSNLRTLDTSSRMNDGHLPARLGGDEFVILLDGVSGVQDAVTVAERLHIELAKPHDLDGHAAVSTASIGIVTSDLGYDSTDDMIRDADTAMYRAKMAGKACHVVFDEKMHQEAVDRLELERELREAVESKAFSLQFEPIVRLQTGDLVGFEALVRWQHPTRGSMPPSDFLALAEELGLIVSIGEWVLRAACQHLDRWKRAHPAHSDLMINVNLSRAQLVHPRLLPSISEALAESDVPASSLCLEITEKMILNDAGSCLPILVEMEKLGVRLVMDDFGTGHSSLSCLHRFPLAILKIDREFIGSVRHRRDYGAIVHSIVELAHNLGLEVVAEGVETTEQLVLLQALECDHAQGHIFSQPMSPDEVDALLQTGPRFGAAA